jgi:hypothetical protein
VKPLPITLRTGAVAAAVVVAHVVVNAVMIVAHLSVVMAHRHAVTVLAAANALTAAHAAKRNGPRLQAVKNHALPMTSPSSAVINHPPASPPSKRQPHRTRANPSALRPK